MAGETENDNIIPIEQGRFIHNLAGVLQVPKLEDQHFDLIDSGRELLKAKLALGQDITEVVSRLLGNALKGIYTEIRSSVLAGNGWEIGERKIRNLFEIAGKLEVPVVANIQGMEHGSRRGIDLDDIPQVTGDEIVVRDNSGIEIVDAANSKFEQISLDQALFHMERIIDDNLAEGLLDMIRLIGLTVAAGKLTADKLKVLKDNIASRLRAMDERVNSKGQKVWTIVSEEDDSSSTSTLSMSDMNEDRIIYDRSIRLSIEKVIRSNLLDGLNVVCRDIGLNIGLGATKPIDQSLINFYEELIKEYHNDEEIKAFLDGSELKDTIEVIALYNLRLGLNAIIERLETSSRAGNSEQIAVDKKVLFEYIELAKKFKLEMEFQIVIDRLQAIGIELSEEEVAEILEVK